MGIFWTLLYPMAMAGVYFFVFKVILHIDTPHYLVLVMCGVLPWTFFSQSVLEASESITGNWGLVTKVPVPVQVFPWVGVLTNFVTLCFALPVLGVIAWLSSAPVGASMVLFPLVLVCLLLLTYSVSLLVAIFSVWYRDLKHLLSIVMQIWFYATPVLYVESMIPLRFEWILWANPLGAPFAMIHDLWLRGAWPHPALMAMSLVWTGFFTALAFWVQRYRSSEIVEAV